MSLSETKEKEIDVKELWTQAMLYSRSEKDSWIGDFTRSRIAGLTRSVDGRLWGCWDTYSGRHEMISVRSVNGDHISELETVQCSESCWAPDLAASPNGELACTWSSKTDVGWNAYVSFRENDQWVEPIRISESNGDHLNSRICFGSGGHAGVVWTRYLEGRTDVMARFHDGVEWSCEYTVSESGHMNMRPELVINETGEAFLVWDCYHDEHYDICSRSIGQEGVSRIYYITNGDAQNFKPTIVLDNQGKPVVAWIHLAYVTTLDLVENLSMIYAARFDGSQWELLVGDNGKEHVAHLGHGVLWENPSLGRKHAGYVGFRRKPMLTTDGDGGVWLLFERNQDPTVSYLKASGMLCGRRLDATGWSREIVLHKGHLAYSTGRFLPGQQEGMCILSRGEGGVDFLKDLCLLQGKFPDLQKCETFNVDESMWSEWEPRTFVHRKGEKRESVKIGEEEYRLYWIDLHCHSCLTGGEAGEPDELYHFARDRGHLDAFAVSDSDVYFGEIMPTNPSAWAIAQLNASVFNRPGNFVTFSGYEWDKNMDYVTGQAVVDGTVASHSESTFNHHNVYFLTDDQPMFRCDEDIAANTARFEKCLNGINGFSSCHHEKWALSDSPKETYVEICSGKGRHIIDHADWIHDYLAKGRMFGFAGMGDTHQRCPGFSGSLTGVYAKELTRQGIAEALLNRRMFATAGSRIVIDFRVNDVFMGQTVTVSNAVKVNFSVKATQPLLYIDIIRDGETIHRCKPKSTCEQNEFIDEACTAGHHFYYLAVRQEGDTPDYPYNLQAANGPWAWSSPVFVEKQ